MVGEEDPCPHALPSLDLSLCLPSGLVIPRAPLTVSQNTSERLRIHILLFLFRVARCVESRGRGIPLSHLPSFSLVCVLLPRSCVETSHYDWDCFGPQISVFEMIPGRGSCSAKTKGSVVR